jgi:FAD/FMN-containing dehydrogenase
MIAERALNPDGEDVIIDDEAILALTGMFKGEIIRPGDAGYDTGRKVWNGLIDKYPALILRAQDTADVVAAVNFVRENDLLVAVRGGGHNVAGTAVVDGGVVIDLSLMRDVEVDPQARIARAQGGATWGDVDRATTEHDLATPGGVVSETGIAGLTLGGGYG